MKKNLYIIIGIVFFIALALAIGQAMMPKNSVITNSTPPTNISEKTEKKEVVMIINYGDGASENFTIEMQDTMTAFDVLKKISEEKNIALETKDYPDMGIFIEKIGNKKNGDGSKYWLYSINGVQPSVASDKIKIQPDDTIKFSFEKSPF